MGCDDNHDLVQHHLAALPATWAVVLEDDAVPIPDFRRQLTQALPMAPSPIVSLYLGQSRPPWAQQGVQAAIDQAEAEHADWIVGTQLLHAVGYAIKTELLPALSNFLSPWPIDQHVTCFAQAHGHLVSYAFPSLVDHADGQTLFTHPDGQPRPPGRVAWKTSPHEHWTSRSVPLRTS